MTVKYKTVITKAGAEKLAAATVPNGKKVNFTAMAVGDGGGTLPTPNASQTKLVREVWRHTLNKVSQDNKHKNYVVAELVIPPETGGFWLREMGLYDDTGTLIAVGNMAESYKPELAEGSGRAQTLRMVIMVSDIGSVELTIDTTLVMATQDYVDDKLAEHEQSRRHPDASLTAKGFTQLSSATDSTSETLAATPKAVKAVRDIADGKYTAQDATTAKKGIVQLSSATDSTSETLAATPKAVKAVRDIADGKYTAQDATTAKKGIVQLSSATDSTSEVLAATPKAVKAANDNANTRFPIAGGWLTGSSGVKTTLGSITFGVGNTDVYIQNGTSNKYLQLGHDGVLKYSGSYIYHEGHKPTASEVDAVSAENGGTFKKEVAFSGGLNIRSGTTGIYPGSDAASFTSANMIFKSWYGIGFYCTLPDSAGDETGMTGFINTRNGLLQMKGQIIPGDYANFDGRFIKLAGNLNITGTLRSSAEFQSTSQNNYRIVSGNFGTFWRNDGSNLYLMLTNSGDQYGGYSSLRPFAINLATGDATINKLALANYANFDARYYTKTLADATFQPKGSYGAPDTSGVSGNVLWWKNTATGVITMMGQTANVGNSGRVTFPFAFPTKCYGVVPTRNNETGNGAAMQPYSVDNTGWNLRIAGGGTETVMWIAMGK
ncbi:phage tail protein [Enterobacter sp. Tr-810]|uniref:tail fiber protein n=1 Tax=Enterobacter sp. Tr-810 TaxID=2608347 RepID=UPI001419F335|nr:tail fiber protein [Enterobacter sp. Tr-810]NIF35382.1 phage tail protein [Enterobacter sp. Tr-810]